LQQHNKVIVFIKVTLLHNIYMDTRYILGCWSEVNTEGLVGLFPRFSLKIKA